MIDQSCLYLFLCSPGVLLLVNVRALGHFGIGRRVEFEGGEKRGEGLIQPETAKTGPNRRIQSVSKGTKHRKKELYHPHATDPHRTLANQKEE